MGCVIAHLSIAVNISRQTNAGLNTLYIFLLVLLLI